MTLVRKTLKRAAALAVIGLWSVGCTTTGPALTPVNSDLFNGAAYDEEAQVLTIQFNHGATYDYSGVPKKVYESFLAAEDAGTFYSEKIKDAYRGRYRLDD